MSRLFLGNIPHMASEDEIGVWLQSYGFIVEAVDIIRDRFTGGHRGFCFASVVDSSQGEEAVKNLNGQVMGGRRITVNHAVPLNSATSNPSRRIA